MVKLSLLGIPRDDNSSLMQGPMRGAGAALLALVFDILLLATTGLYLLWSACIAVCAVVYLYLRREQPA